MDDLIYKVISESEYKANTNVDDIPKGHVRKRDEAPYGRLTDFLSRVTRKTKLELNRKYNVASYEPRNLGSSKWPDWVKIVSMDEYIFKRETPTRLVTASGYQIGKEKILAIIDDGKIVDYNELLKRREVAPLSDLKDRVKDLL
jgi:hypothetical protein